MTLCGHFYVPIQASVLSLTTTTYQRQNHANYESLSDPRGVS